MTSVNELEIYFVLVSTSTGNRYEKSAKLMLCGFLPPSFWR